MTNVAAVPTSEAQPLGVLDRLARPLVLKRLAELQGGEIILHDSAGTNSVGEVGDLRATVRVHRPRFFRQALFGGKLSVAESYLRGDWDCDDLTSLVRIFVRNLRGGDRIERGLVRIPNFIRRMQHLWRANTKSGSRRNIGAHYDLGNDFFRLWLDDTLAYSSGIFRDSSASLADASREKFDRVCRKLDLRSADQVLEIGSGWGGFALHAANHYDCRVTTTTISQEQYALARQRVNQERRGGQINLLLEDYRDLTGQYDKLVSIEMIEAVGHRYLDAYLNKCSQLLRPDGSMVLQAIVMPERDHRQYLRSVDYIQKYVFPGGCLPSLSTILASVGRSTDMRLVHAEDFAPHYAQTLRHWRRNFVAKLDAVRELGYSEQFIRLWNFYLCYCEAVFEERHVGVLQIQLDKPRCRRDDLRNAPSPDRNPNAFWNADALQSRQVSESEAAAMH